jgi:hypothetical protein
MPHPVDPNASEWQQSVTNLVYPALWSLDHNGIADITIDSTNGDLLIDISTSPGPPNKLLTSVEFMNNPQWQKLLGARLRAVLPSS